MTIENKKIVLKEFQQIPGVGKVIAQDLWELGYRSVAELKRQNPEAMYEKLSLLKGCRIDRCMLYVFRCTVYYVSTDTHDPELLKWWHWKNRN